MSNGCVSHEPQNGALGNRRSIQLSYGTSDESERNRSKNTVLAHTLPTPSDEVLVSTRSAGDDRQELNKRDGFLGARDRASNRVAAGLLSLTEFPPAFVARLRLRFEAKVTPEPMSGCMLWFGARNRSGYGTIGVGARAHSKPMNRVAHRVAWLLEHGEMAEGLVLDHLCRNPACVNPRHLEPVTHTVNMRRGHASRELEAANLAMGRALVSLSGLAVTP